MNPNRVETVLGQFRTRLNVDYLSSLEGRSELNGFLRRGWYSSEFRFIGSGKVIRFEAGGRDVYGIDENGNSVVCWEQRQSFYVPIFELVAYASADMSDVAEVFEETLKSLAEKEDTRHKALLEAIGDVSDTEPINLVSVPLRFRLQSLEECVQVSFFEFLGMAVKVPHRERVSETLRRLEPGIN